MNADNKKLIQTLLHCSLSVINNKPYGIYAGEDFFPFTDDTPQQESVLTKIHNKINSCNRCLQSKHKKINIEGIGVENPKVLVLLADPSGILTSTNPLLHPKAEDLLKKMLSAINLSLDTNCYLTSITKCMGENSRKSSFFELDACKSFLDAEIQILKPKYILILGDKALQFILQTKETLQNLHGTFFEYQNIPTIATYHPNVLLKNPTLKAPTWEDLKSLREKLLKDN